MTNLLSERIQLLYLIKIRVIPYKKRTSSEYNSRLQLIVKVYYKCCSILIRSWRNLAFHSMSQRVQLLNPRIILFFRDKKERMC